MLQSLLLRVYVAAHLIQVQYLKLFAFSLEGEAVKKDKALVAMR